MRSIPRGDWSNAKYAVKGTWTRSVVRGKKTARVCCLYCGFVNSLSRHTIDKDGVVRPAVRCMLETCRFHEDIKLGRWRG